jgi:hypothetical protein
MLSTRVLSIVLRLALVGFLAGYPGVPTSRAQESAGETNHRIAESRVSQLADLLFPESKSWRSIDQLPVLETRRYYQQLSEAYGDFLARTPSSQVVCELSRLFFTPAGEAKTFHVFPGADVEHDDLIYTGDAECTEGGKTIVWKNFRIWSRQQAFSIAGQAIRFSSIPKPRAVMFEAGCCADPINQFSIRDPFSGRWFGRFRVAKALDLPAGLQPDDRINTYDHDLILRSAPVVDDKYDVAMSHRLGSAVFGSVVRKFLPGISARQMTTYTDTAATRWLLIAIDQAYDAKAYYTALPSDVGWVKADTQPGSER